MLSKTMVQNTVENIEERLVRLQDHVIILIFYISGWSSFWLGEIRRF